MISPTTINDLPADAIGLILMKLPYKEILKTGLVSSRFSSIGRKWHFWADKSFKDFNFPYEVFNNLVKGDPRRIYRELLQCRRDPDFAMVKYVVLNYNHLIIYLMKNTRVTNLDKPLDHAIIDGNLKLVQYLVQEGLSRSIDLRLDRLLNTATHSHHLEIVEYLLSVMLSQHPVNTNFLDDILYISAAGGDLPIVQYILQKGAIDLDSGLRVAAEYNHFPMVQFFIERGVNDFHDALLSAASKGHLEMCQYLVQMGVTNFNDGLIVAAENGHLNVSHFMVQNGANYIDEAMEKARKNGHQHIVQFLITSLGSIDTTEDMDETDDTAST